MNDSSVRQCVAHFCHRHREELGVPYMPSHGKDQAIIKNVIGTYGMEKTMILIDSFFKDIKINPFLQKTGASIGIMKTQIPKLLMKERDTTEKSQIGVL